MATIKSHSMKSDTKYIQMVAFKEDPKNPEQPDREWYLAVHVSGTEIEFLAAEGFTGFQIGMEEALTRIKEFEKTMHAENQNYVQSLVKSLMCTLEKEEQREWV